MTLRIVKLLLLATFTVPATAGQWVVTETDTAYIVEYRGHGDEGAVKSDILNERGMAAKRAHAERTGDDADIKPHPSAVPPKPSPATGSSTRHD